jgi:hypothetical protein
MDILNSATLPAPLELSPGTFHCPAREAANALAELARDTQADAVAMLAQLGAAPDVTPQAIAIGLKLQQLLADLVAVAGELQAVAAAR